MSPARAAMCLLGLLVALGANPAGAQGKRRERATSSLNWVRLPGSEDCITARALATAVETRLGRAVFVSASRGDLSIEGRVEPIAGGAGFRATIAASDAQGAPMGVREIRTESRCSALDAQLVLVISLMIDPDAVLGPARPDAPVSEPPPPAPPPPPPAPPVVEPERPRPPVPSRPPHGEVRLGGSMGTGLLPGIYGGAVAAAAIGPQDVVRFELYGAMWLPKTHIDASGSGARFLAGYAGPALCLETRPRPLRLGICAGGDIGAISWQSRGFTQEQHGVRMLIDGTLRGRGEARIAGPLFGYLGLGLVVPFRRPGFTFYERSEDGTLTEKPVFSVGSAAGTLELGFALHFSS